MTTPAPRPATLVVLDEWRAWDHLRQAIDARIDAPGEEANIAVQQAMAAYVASTGRGLR
jgi:hypothetical protein